MPYVRTILTDEHPTLRKVAKRVEREELRDPIFQQLIDDMFETMYHAPGIGLAAPQVDVEQAAVRRSTCRSEEGERGPLVLINPQIVEAEGEVDSVEGCLSVPGMIGDVKRFERVVVRRARSPRPQDHARRGRASSAAACSTNSITSTASSTPTRRGTSAPPRRRKSTPRSPRSKPKPRRTRRNARPPLRPPESEAALPV